MNVRNTKTRVPTAEDIHNLPAEPLAGNNAIPKQHVGTDQTNQLQFDQATDRVFSPISNQQTYTNQMNFNVIPTAYFCVDENPFDLLSEDLFDTSLSGDDELNQPETNEEVVRTPPEEVHQSIENNGGFEEIQEDEYEESLPQDEGINPPRPHNVLRPIKPVVDHPIIKPIVENWLEGHKWTGKQLSKRKSEINKFIRFLVDKKIQLPTKEHIRLYHQALLNDPKVSFFNPYVSAVSSLFLWAKEFGLYENIAYGVKFNQHPNSPIIRPQPKKRVNGSLIRIPKSTITIHDMERAQFRTNEAKYLIDNDLIVFERWVETLDVGSVDDRRKVYLLKFAHFLHTESRTTPTQQDIVDYYKKFLTDVCPDTADKSILAIRRFFTWTAEKTIYPNIAINICTTKRKPINDDDIPILPDEICMLHIPNPTEPLINKTI